MDMEQTAIVLSGTILVCLAIVVIAITTVVINNILHKYWKPVRIFTADSFQPFGRYATEEEIQAAYDALQEKKLKSKTVGKNEA